MLKNIYGSLSRDDTSYMAGNSYQQLDRLGHFGTSRAIEFVIIH